MMIKYLGTEGAADPAGTEAFGIWFPIGEPVEVSDRFVIGKLSNHPHFDVVDDKTTKPKLGLPSNA